MSRRYCSNECRLQAERAAKREASARNVAECPACGETRVVKARGHCTRCYQRLRLAGDRGPPHEPTEAELNQMIAEQMKCLPSWWHHDAEAMRNGLVDR